VERSLGGSDRPTRVLGSLQALINNGRLAGHGLRLNPAGRSGDRAFRGRVVRTEPGVLRSGKHREARHRRRLQRRGVDVGRAWRVARKYAHKIPFLLKFNHNEFLSYPNSFDQIRFANIKQAFDMGAVGVGATIYFGSENPSGSFRK
jgi:class I fructose-bisphosphate aldolase